MSRSQQALEFLAAHPGRPFSLTELLIALQLTSQRDRDRLRTDLANCVRKAGPNSSWRHVSRVDVGVYVFKAGAVKEKQPATWSEVAADPSGAVVLRSPDDSLFIATKAVK